MNELEPGFSKWSWLRVRVRVRVGNNWQLGLGLVEGAMVSSPAVANLPLQ